LKKKEKEKEKELFIQQNSAELAMATYIAFIILFNLFLIVTK
jgi:hypothetical protein